MASGPSPTPISILVVDDDRFMLDILPAWIEKTFQAGRGTRVLTARSPAEVLARIDEECPDVVLSDYDLRDAVNGVRLLEQVDARCPGTVRVLFSGHTRHEIGRDLESKSLHGFLEKPMRLSEMMAPLRAIVERELVSGS